MCPQITRKLKLRCNKDRADRVYGAYRTYRTYGEDGVGLFAFSLEYKYGRDGDENRHGNG